MQDSRLEEGTRDVFISHHRSLCRWLRLLQRMLLLMLLL